MDTAQASSSGELAAVLRSFRGLFAGVAAFSCAINLLMLGPALYMLQVYDRVLASRNETTLLMLTLILLGLYGLEAALEWVRARALVRASAAFDMRLAPRVFDAAFRRTLGGASGSAGQAPADLAQMRQFLTGAGLFAFLDAPWIPIYLAVIFLLHPWLGAFSLAAAVLLLLLAWVNEQATAAPLAQGNQQAQRANDYAGRQLRHAEAIEAMGMLGGLRQRWLGLQTRMLALQAQASDNAAAVGAASRLVRLATQSGILGFGALLVIDQRLSAGAMIAASILLGRALGPLDQAIAAWRGLVSARGAYARLRELLAAHPGGPPRTALPRPQGEILVEDLVVAPPGSRRPVLKGVRFGTAAGMLVAVVGPSASGKSTLARALVGVWPPLSGSVRLDRADVHQWDKSELGPWLGYLPQDVELFEGSIAENIARFGPRDDARIVEAAQRAGVHEMILRLGQGYETAVGDGGAALSGGQRQRIGLARALYGDPALLVLDEPDASLDDAGDAALARTLQELKAKRRTVFLVTHRSSLLSLADAVLVLAGGVVQSYGPPAAVLATVQQIKGPGMPTGPRQSLQQRGTSP